MNRFDYGNYKDITFSTDSLMNSWIMGSIEISPLEQVEFIDKLLHNQLNVSTKATQETIEVIKLEKIFDDWQLYGKSGGAIDLGWFIGLIKKGERIIIFAQYIEQSKDALISGGRVAKEIAKDNLISLMLQ